ncbi:hypothetical protein K0M31_015474, partial [Melipona bicolor]
PPWTVILEAESRRRPPPRNPARYLSIPKLEQTPFSSSNVRGILRAMCEENVLLYVARCASLFSEAARAFGASGGFWHVQSSL